MGWLLRGQFAQFILRGVQQVPQHRDFGGDPRVQRRIHVWRKEWRMIGRQGIPFCLGLGEFLWISTSQSELEARHALVDEV